MELSVRIKQGDAIFHIASSNIAMVILEKMSEVINSSKKENDELDNELISTMYLMYHNIGVSHLQDVQKAIILGLTYKEYAEMENLEDISDFLAEK